MSQLFVIVFVIQSINQSINTLTAPKLLNSNVEVTIYDKFDKFKFQKSFKVRVPTHFPFQNSILFQTQISKPLGRFSDHILKKWFIEHYFQLYIWYIVQSSVNIFILSGFLSLLLSK